MHSKFIKEMDQVLVMNNRYWPPWETWRSYSNTEVLSVSLNKSYISLCGYLWTVFLPRTPSGDQKCNCSKLLNRYVYREANILLDKIKGILMFARHKNTRVLKYYGIYHSLKSNESFCFMMETMVQRY